MSHGGNEYSFPRSRSKHEEIDLVSEEEFYQEAPPEISRPQLTKNDPHQLTLARLDWELEQRKRYFKTKKTPKTHGRVKDLCLHKAFAACCVYKLIC